MLKMNVVNLKNEVVKDIELPAAIFGQKVNQPLILQVVKAHLAGMRQGTVATKTKGLVRGGGRKPFKQKGTGNARQGSIRSPLMPGGGSAFGPQPRDYSQRTPKKMFNGALKSILSEKLQSKRLVIVDSLKLNSEKTKNFLEIMQECFKVNEALIIDFNLNQNLELASRNCPKYEMSVYSSINPYDILKYEWLFLSSDVVEILKKRLM